MQLYQKIILESIQSHKDLDKFTSFILERELKEIKTDYKKNLADLEFYKDTPKLVHFTTRLKILATDINRNLYSNEFYRVLIETPLIITFLNGNATEKGFTRGNYHYSTNTISLYYDENDYDIKNAIQHNQDFLWKDILETRKSTLIHELQHWFDAIRSYNNYKLGYVNTPSAKEYNNSNNLNLTIQQKHELYQNQYHEIIARFAQVVNSMKTARIRSPQDAVDFLIWNFDNWKKTSPEIQKKLKKRIVQIYLDYRRKNIRSDLTTILEKYKDKKTSEGYNIHIYSDKENIFVDMLDGENVEKTLQEINRLADIYRYNTIIDNSILKKMDKNTIKKLGYKRNIGKNQDFRFNTGVFYRYPRRDTLMGNK